MEPANSVHAIPSFIFKSHFNIIQHHSCPLQVVSFRFSKLNFVFIYLFRYSGCECLMHFLHSSAIPAGEGICSVLCWAYVLFLVESYMIKLLKTMGYGLLFLIKHVPVISRFYLKLTFCVLPFTLFQEPSEASMFPSCWLE